MLNVKRKAVSGILVTLLLMSILAPAFNIQSVEAEITPLINPVPGQYANYTWYFQRANETAYGWTEYGWCLVTYLSYVTPILVNVSTDDIYGEFWWLVNVMNRIMFEGTNVTWSFWIETDIKLDDEIILESFIAKVVDSGIIDAAGFTREYWILEAAYPSMNMTYLYGFDKETGILIYLKHFSPEGVTNFLLASTNIFTRAHAEFVLSDLSITPEEAKIWEEIEISFTVTNVGEETGNYQFSLLIEEPYAAESVEMVGVLDAGESETATYKLTPQNFGYYKFEVDGLTDTLSLKAPILTPAEFVFSDLEVTPQEVEPGATVMVSAIITNIGEKGGIHIVELKQDGEVVDSESITLNGGVGDSATVTLKTSSEAEGRHSVEIDGLSGSFKVKPEPSFWDKIPGFPYESIIIGLISVIIIIWHARNLNR